jgi:hypothetical protein
MSMSMAIDLLVNGVGYGVRLFLNDGAECSAEATLGLVWRVAPQHVALADIDGDTDLDLYVANYRSSSLQDEFNVRFRVSITNNQRVITMTSAGNDPAGETIRYSVGPNNAITELEKLTCCIGRDGAADSQDSARQVLATPEAAVGFGSAGRGGDDRDKDLSNSARRSRSRLTASRPFAVQPALRRDFFFRQPRNRTARAEVAPSPYVVGLMNGKIRWCGAASPWLGESRDAPHEQWQRTGC